MCNTGKNKNIINNSELELYLTVANLVRGNLPAFYNFVFEYLFQKNKLEAKKFRFAISLSTWIKLKYLLPAININEFITYC